MTEKAKILVVDDHPTNLMLMLSVLSKDYQVSVVTSGYEALALAESLNPDLILLDIMMPGMDGLEVLQHIREAHWGHEMTVVLVTADDSHDTEVMGLKLGADDFITKPFSLPILQLRINNLLVRNQARKQLQQTVARLEEAESIAHLGHWVIELETGALEWSKQTYRLFGVEPDTMVTFELFTRIIHPEDQSKMMAAWNKALSAQGVYQIEHRVLLGNEVRWIRERLDLGHQNENGKVVGTALDITEHKRLQEKLDQMAYYDALTGLPNRSLLADRLHQAMAQADRHQLRIAVLFLDLDGFKPVNDCYGHEAGDILLKELAERLTLELREGDTLARLGGDEFIALLVDLPQQGECESLFQRLLKVVAKPFHYQDHQLEVTASIGVSYYPQTQSLDANQLIRQADQAMYQAKQAGKNQMFEFKG